MGMKDDAKRWMKGLPAHKPVSKETLNHPKLVEMVSGLDVYENTPEAFLRAYEALGIDLVNRVPTENAPVATEPKTSRPHPTHPDYALSPLGIYDTAARMRHPCADPDEIWDFKMGSTEYADLVTPVPHSCSPADIAVREKALGGIGAYYPMLYTTLFMWPVEVFGWEVFMVAAMEDPERFFGHILKPCIGKSKAIVAGMAEGSSNEAIFVHDDLCDARGPVFPPDWYEAFIFPAYESILEPARRLGKKVVLVVDGNIAALLPRLRALGFDGLMFENPATPLDAIFGAFDRPDDLLIGGMDTVALTNGDPDQVRAMVESVMETTANRPGFALSSCGGLHGNIPLENLEAYFDARAHFGFNPKDWRNVCRA